MGIASTILLAVAAYAGVGIVVGSAFVIRGIGVIDHATRGAGAPWHFRLIILPGAAALWPLVLTRWIRAGRAPAETHP